MESKLAINENIDKEELNYRIDNLFFSQSMLSSLKKNKAEFMDKYIRNIFWSDDTAKDREYEKNMSYGRDFHKMCQRAFLDIPEELNITSASRDEKKRIYTIKEQYISMFGKDNVKFCPEYSIELNSLRLQVKLDLLVKVYKDGKLSKLFIWDWKVEEINISIEKALKRMQTITYMYVSKETVGKDLNYEDIVMYYYQPKKNKNTKIIYSREKHKEYEREIIKTIEEIKELKA